MLSPLLIVNILFITIVVALTAYIWPLLLIAGKKIQSQYIAPRNDLIEFTAFAGVVGIVMLALAKKIGLFFVPTLDPAYLFVFSFLIAYFFFLSSKDPLDIDRKDRYSYKLYTLLFLSVSFVGLVIRLLQIFDQGTTVDALYHLNEAQRLSALMPIEYSRALLYTMLIAIVQTFFGTSLVVVHIFTTLLNYLAITVVFFLCRRYFSDKIGLITAMLLLFSPWSIVMAQFIRMYELFQILFLLTAIGFFTLLRQLWIPIQTQPRRTYHTFITFWLSLLKSKFIFLLVVTAIAAYHVHKLTVGLLPILALLFLLLSAWRVGLYLRNRQLSLRTILLDPIIFLTVIGLLSAFIIYQLFPAFVGSYLASASINVDFSILQRARSYYQFYFTLYDPDITYMLIGVATGVMLALHRTKRMFLAYIYAIYFGYLFQFLFVYTRFFSPRYSYHLLPFFTIILAVGVYGIWHICVTVSSPLIHEYLRSSSVTRKLLAISSLIRPLLLIIVLLAIIPIRSIIDTFDVQTSGENAVYEINYPYADIVQLIDIQPNDYLFEQTTGVWELWQDSSAQIHNVSARIEGGQLRPTQQIMGEFFEELTQADHGWFVTDIYRHEKWNCGSAFPCPLRDMLNTSFNHESELHQIENLLFFEWNPIKPSQVVVNAGLDASTIVSGTNIESLALIAHVDSSEVTIDGKTFSVPVSITPLAENTDGLFVSFELQTEMEDGKVFEAGRQTMWIPSSELDRFDRYDFVLTGTSLDERKNKREIAGITAEVTVTDIGGQIVYSDSVDSITLFTSSNNANQAENQ